MVLENEAEERKRKPKYHEKKTPSNKATIEEAKKQNGQTRDQATNNQEKPKGGEHNPTHSQD